LKGGDDVAGYEYWINSHIRHCRVAALAFHNDGEAISRRHHRSRSSGKLTDLDVGKPVEPEDHVDRFAQEFSGEHAVFTHAVAAGPAFLGGLEEHEHVVASHDRLR
jgi:hypothetical protein